MQDRPDINELLAGVARFLKEQAAPALENPLRFHALVAANLLAICQRELAGEPAALKRELAGLRALLGREAGEAQDPAKETTALNRELGELIRQGAADRGEFRQRVLAHLAATLDDALAIANPAMAEKAAKVY